MPTIPLTKTLVFGLLLSVGLSWAKGKIVQPYSNQVYEKYGSNSLANWQKDFLYATQTPVSKAFQTPRIFAPKKISSCRKRKGKVALPI